MLSAANSIQPEKKENADGTTYEDSSAKNEAIAKAKAALEAAQTEKTSADTELSQAEQDEQDAQSTLSEKEATFSDMESTVAEYESEVDTLTGEEESLQSQLDAALAQEQQEAQETQETQEAQENQNDKASESETAAASTLETTKNEEEETYKEPASQIENFSEKISHITTGDVNKLTDMIGKLSGSDADRETAEKYISDLNTRKFDTTDPNVAAFSALVNAYSTKINAEQCNGDNLVDPISFTGSNAHEYDFITDLNLNETSDFLGATSGIGELTSLDADNNGTVEGDELSGISFLDKTDMTTVSLEYLENELHGEISIDISGIDPNNQNSQGFMVNVETPHGTMILFGHNSYDNVAELQELVANRTVYSESFLSKTSDEDSKEMSATAMEGSSKETATEESAKYLSSSQIDEISSCSKVLSDPNATAEEKAQASAKIKTMRESITEEIPSDQIARFNQYLSSKGTALDENNIPILSSGKNTDLETSSALNDLQYFANVQNGMPEEIAGAIRNAWQFSQYSSMDGFKWETTNGNDGNCQFFTDGLIGFKSPTAWCAGFATTIYGAATTGLFGGGEYTPIRVKEIRDNAKDSGLFHKNDGNYKPSSGDLVVFSPSHIGMVLDQDEKQGIYYTIEGNVGGSIRRIKREMNDKNIVGFIDMYSYYGAEKSQNSRVITTSTVRFEDFEYIDSDVSTR